MQIHSIRQELIRDRRDSERGRRRPRSTASSQRTTGSICCERGEGEPHRRCGRHRRIWPLILSTWAADAAFRSHRPTGRIRQRGARVLQSLQRLSWSWRASAACQSRARERHRRSWCWRRSKCHGRPPIALHPPNVGARSDDNLESKDDTSDTHPVPRRGHDRLSVVLVMLDVDPGIGG